MNIKKLCAEINILVKIEKKDLNDVIEQIVIQLDDYPNPDLIGYRTNDILKKIAKYLELTSLSVANLNEYIQKKFQLDEIEYAKMKISPNEHRIISVILLKALYHRIYVKPGDFSSIYSDLDEYIEKYSPPEKVSIIYDDYKKEYFSKPPSNTNEIDGKKAISQIEDKKETSNSSDEYGWTFKPPISIEKQELHVYEAVVLFGSDERQRVSNSDEVKSRQFYLICYGLKGFLKKYEEGQRKYLITRMEDNKYTFEFKQFVLAMLLDDIYNNNKHISDVKGYITFFKDIIDMFNIIGIHDLRKLSITLRKNKINELANSLKTTVTDVERNSERKKRFGVDKYDQLKAELMNIIKENKYLCS